MKPSMIRDHRIDPAHETRGQADHHADHGRQRGDGEPHDQRDAGAVDHARVHVAAEQVGTEPELFARRAGAVDGRERGGVHRAQPGRADRHQEQQQEQPAAHRRGRVALEKTGNIAHQYLILGSKAR
ncbi:hypothetical protein [Bordetella parapertussis]|uniref:hypothetical protein n=1 Tax=Bordetella parapertussis TaxID=519 RepID=UPI001E58F3F1|nr:hypothetical protein [Bordetella parapertussis]